MKNAIKILFILLLVNIQILAQNKLFKSLTVQEGLSDEDINCIIQDKKGFLWIGTESGLNRYDGYEFKIFKYNQNDKNSLPNNSIWSLYEDKKGNIWIGTKSGDLVRFSPIDEKFYTIEFANSKITDNSITSIIEDTKGDIWFGTYSNGLYRYKISNGQIKNWDYERDLPNTLSNNYVTSLLVDKYGGIWATTYNGLNYINPNEDENKIVVYRNKPGNNNSINNDLIWNISESKYDDDLLFICNAGGLNTYNQKSKKFGQINFVIEYPSQFSSGVASVVEDKSENENILWIATYGGLFKLDLNSGKSKQFIADKENSMGLITNQIDRIMMDKSGVLWLITDKGLNYLPSSIKKINYRFLDYLSQPIVQELFKTDIKAILALDSRTTILGSPDGAFSLTMSNGNILLKKIEEIRNLNIWSLEKGSDNSIWIGTYGNGLFNYNLKTKKIKKYPIESPTFKTSAFEYIRALKLGFNDTLWVGFWGGGLGTLNTLTGKYKIWIPDPANPNSISYNDISKIHLDKSGRVWIATNGGGLNLFIPKNGGKFLHWTYSANNKNSILNNALQCITEQQTNNSDETILYIGSDIGLNKMIIKNRGQDIYDLDVNFINLSEQLNIPDVSVRNIVLYFDDIWISTNKGIYQYKSESKKLFNYGISDGCGSLIFNSNAAVKLADNSIVFGSAKGPALLNPNMINHSYFEPNIVFTDFLIFNESISNKNNAPLNKSIAYTDTIILAYSENVITFKFSALDFNSNEGLNYVYKMEGFDNKWTQLNKTNSASYTNLNPGNYTFRVKGTNSDGKWGTKEADIQIKIKYPWWRTIWAYIAYVIVIIVILLLIRRFEVSRTHLRNELKNLEFEAKKLKEIEMMKSRFFANISHEFRTPLMLIKGPLEQLLVKKGNSDELTKMAFNNTEKLKSLIDQLLDLSKLESNLIPLNTNKVDLSIIIKGFIYSFKAVTEQKNIVLDLDCPDEKMIAEIDLDKFEKIINNLLSNAYKFTPAGGSILVSVKKRFSNDQTFYDLIIKDSGIGIPEDKISKIFDRFYQVDDSSNRSYGGSGIGLSLVKEFVELHQWEISVKSSPSKGTQFLISIPAISSEIAEDVDYKLTEDEISKQSNEVPIYIQNDEEPILLSKDSETKPTILIVEDSKEVRQFIKGLLIDSYSIIEAEDGKKGIEMAINILPELIISDVMMPVMDGLEFCKKIKTDIQTSHIPVILLTAKATGDSKLEGLETGADEYLTKPFELKELLIRVKNLLESRKILKEKFSKDVYVKPENIAVNQLDKEFLDKAFQVAEKNIDKPEFDSEEFAKEMYLSRSQFHRKLQAVTGQAPGEFMRIFRLKKAAKLLLENNFSVTQIAYEVGFNSPSHFTKAFKQMFNCLPSEYVNKNNF